MIPIYKQLITTVIAPHGITDIIHAVQYNMTTELVTFNGLTIGTSYVLSEKAPLLLDGAFIVASVVHFRHDMPHINAIPRATLSAALIAVSIMYDPNILILYMVLSHVPNHYRTNWKYINTDKKNVGLIVLFTMVLFFGGEIFPSLYESGLTFDCAKGLIISHVLYNEKHIYKDE